MNLAHFGLRRPSQTDSYYLLKDPEGRSCQLHATQLSKPMGEKKKQQLPAIFTASLRGQGTMSVCLYVCDRETRGAREREIEMKQSSPYVKSDWNILAISHRVADIIWEA